MAKRIEKIHEFMNDNNIDALLIKSKTMKKWLSTMTGSGCNVLITKNKGFLILDGRYLTEAKEKEHDLEIILHSSHGMGCNYLSAAQDILKKEDCHNLGVEASQMLVKEYRDVEKIGVPIILLDEEIDNLRIVKQQEEIDIMQEAVDITDDIYKKVLANIHVGMTEYEISALVQYYSIAQGAQQMSFDTIVATGERTAFPHGRPTGRRVKAHEPIMIDFGIQYKNYQSDMTRMCFLGEPESKIKEIYDIVLKAQLVGLNAINAGVIASDVDKAARDVTTKNGYGQYFNHGLGHGLGIGDGCELPILNSTSKTILKEHMMMSCEPGIYVPNIGGVRIEDDVVIIDGRGVPLNKTTKDYIILEVK
ncbi:peptidase M24 [Clostridium sp. MF28]|uniref:M24 family metallopeptidase n=1 Tax=Clostridium TaxID=1485 RepID=UPI0003D31053|nr:MULTISPECIES: Xaa-Pro peptidase family protein [Clostridium]ALB46094.1 aminopeptidase P family protein [Clostridium beijerinckii NRRL B-598]AVK46800.1 peptidase M24 [Clostridium sp. MF28]